jgi:hypothetical protein
MDLVKRAGQLKPMLVKFAMSPLFDRELSMPSLLDPYPWTFPTRFSTRTASRSTSSQARE